MQVFLDSQEWKDYQKHIARLDALNPQLANCGNALKRVLDEGTGDLCIRPDSELFEVLTRLGIAKEKLKCAFEMAEFVATQYYCRTPEYLRLVAKEDMKKTKE